MRKYLCFLLTALLLAALLTGCDTGGVPAPTGPNIESTQPTSETTVPNEGTEAPVVYLPMPENPGNNLVEYDPDREVYILLENMDVTIYGPVYGFSLTVMSKHVLDPTQMQIQIPCENAYETVGFTMSEFNYRNTEYEYGSSDSYLPFYVYQNYLGVDFSLAGKLYDWYTDPPEAGTQEAEEMEAVTGGQDPKVLYDQLINTGADSFAAMKPEDTREFYIYTASVRFSVTVEETLTELDVIIGEETYHQKIGRLQLIPGEYPTMYPTNEKSPWTGMGFAFGGGGTTFYGSGIHEIFLFEGTTAENMVLEGFRIAEKDFSVLDVFLLVTSNGVTMEMDWDGESPITLYEGDTVSIAAVIRNEKLASFMFRLGMNYELAYSIDGEMFSQCSSTFIEPAVNYHEIYAIVFDGVDMEPYYRDYYYPIYQQWQNEYQ